MSCCTLTRGAAAAAVELLLFGDDGETPVLDLVLGATGGLGRAAGCATSSMFVEVGEAGDGLGGLLQHCPITAVTAMLALSLGSAPILLTR